MDADHLVSMGAGLSGSDRSDRSVRPADAETGDIEWCLRTVLRPVEPSPIFREELRLRLASSVRRDRSQVQVASTGELPRELLVGAALLSVAGALVYFWRTRLPQAAPHAVALLENIPPAKGMSFPVA